MVNFIFILVTTSFFIEAVNAAGTCNKPFEIKTQNLNKRLIGHTIEEFSGPDHHACARECMSLKVCKSIDYHIKDKTCKLNDADSSSVDEKEFEMKGGAIFSDISEWPSTMVNKCGPKPCTDKQKCVSNEEKYTCLDIPDAGCGGTFNDESGIIISPNYPNEYNNDVQRVWIVTVNSRCRITLRFTNMDIERAARCGFDYIEVRDGSHEDSPLMGLYCGDDLPIPLTTTQNILFVKFASDKSVRRAGFRAIWEVVE